MLGCNAEFLYSPRKFVNEKLMYMKNVFNHSDKLKTGLHRGDWFDLDHKILYALFNELRLFVREEKGYLQYNADRRNGTLSTSKKWSKLSDNQKLEFGFRHLQWEKSLINECKSQAECADIQEDLLVWWLTYDDRSLDEGEYELENTQLKRLIDIRKSLWT